ncbi:MAG: phosphoglucomutase/phosphomannomutase family protein [Candidatus Gastranaerophilales bacterium]|nr:phosphoglucomutase/phosphomannomutase family protein [Candidatus Gastranaerophilales bacterium]
MIKFGTDGWRAILDKEFNAENVERVTLAIGKYVAETFGFDKLIIIGYDPRRMADEYAQLTANLLYQKGFRVKLSNRVVPTPVLAYNAKHLNACAIMFTASHNPPEYLGMKFIPDYAGPATSEITDKIVANLDLEYGFGESGSLEKVDFMPDYYEHLKTLVDFDKIKGLNIIFDGLYSASIGYFDYILKDNNIPFESLHMEHDVNFGGGMPDPKPKYLKDLIEKVKNNSNSIGLANDGDADRFGVINENGEYVSPNEIIAILLKYLQSKGVEGAVVKTVGSSLLIDNVAKKLGVDVIETAVGFKHVGEAMRQNKVIIGGEESGGLSISGHIPEKDGLIANLLIMEVMAVTGKTLIELQDEIYELAGCKFYTDRIDLKTEDVKPILEHFKGLKKVGEYDVTGIDLKDGVKLSLGDKTKILVRPSGTEPLLRIYFETDSLEKLEALKLTVEQK